MSRGRCRSPAGRSAGRGDMAAERGSPGKALDPTQPQKARRQRARKAQLFPTCYPAPKVPAPQAPPSRAPATQAGTASPPTRQYMQIVNQQQVGRPARQRVHVGHVAQQLIAWRAAWMGAQFGWVGRWEHRPVWSRYFAADQGGFAAWQQAGQDSNGWGWTVGQGVACQPTGGPAHWDSAPLATYLMRTRSQAGSPFCTPSGSSGGDASSFSLHGGSRGLGGHGCVRRLGWSATEGELQGARPPCTCMPPNHRAARSPSAQQQHRGALARQAQRGVEQQRGLAAALWPAEQQAACIGPVGEGRQRPQLVR